jgi:RNA polymerase sigma-70 factor, ECF subfamily
VTPRRRCGVLLFWPVFANGALWVVETMQGTQIAPAVQSVQSGSKIPEEFRNYPYQVRESLIKFGLRGGAEVTLVIHIETILPELRAYARSVAENREDAEDLVHDAIERALRSDKRPGSLEDFRPWMFRIIRNLNLDELRKKRVRMEYSRAQSRLSVDMKQGQNHADDLLIRMTFETLPASMREVLFLVDVMGMKYAEAAEIMGVPHGTVMSRVSRARKALIKAMKAETDPAEKDKIA